MNSAFTPWFNWPVKPVRPGMYHLQDKTMNCSCCWIEAHWNGTEWHTDLFGTRGVFNTLFFDNRVKRWRGLRGVIRLRPQLEAPKQLPVNHRSTPLALSKPTGPSTCSTSTKANQPCVPSGI